MAGYKTDQTRLRHRGKEFHFVSYEGHGANPAKGEAATPAMWFLMRSGHRYAVMPQVDGQEADDRDREFAAWLDAFAFSAPSAPRTSARRRTA